MKEIDFSAFFKEYYPLVRGLKSIRLMRMIMPPELFPICGKIGADLKNHRRHRYIRGFARGQNRFLLTNIESEIENRIYRNITKNCTASRILTARQRTRSIALILRIYVQGLENGKKKYLRQW